MCWQVNFVPRVLALSKMLTGCLLLAVNLPDMRLVSILSSSSLRESKRVYYYGAPEFPKDNTSLSGAQDKKSIIFQDYGGSV